MDTELLQQEVLAQLPFASLVALWHTSRACRRLVSTFESSYLAETRLRLSHTYAADAGHARGGPPCVR